MYRNKERLRRKRFSLLHLGKSGYHVKIEDAMTVQRSLRCLILVLVFSLVCAAFGQTLRTDTFRPVVRGTRGVVAGGHPLVAEAGMRMLHRGGNAVDAGVAAVLAGSVIEFSHFAFGGEVPVIIKPANKPVITINGQGQAPELATREFFEKRTP